MNLLLTPIRSLLLPCILFFFSLLQCPAQAAQLIDVVITNSRNELTVYLKIKDAFTEPMKQAILSGVSTTFSFDIAVEHIRSFWANKTLTEMTLTHTLKYNNLKKEFIVRRSWENDRPLVTESFEQARKLMSEIDAVPVISLDNLEKGSPYQVRAKAKLSKMTLPFYLRYMPVMNSMGEFETEWQVVDFTY